MVLSSFNLFPYSAIRWEQDKPRSTTPELQLSEACALVHSLPQWKVADTVRVLFAFIFYHNDVIIYITGFIHS